MSTISLIVAALAPLIWCCVSLSLSSNFTDDDDIHIGVGLDSPNVIGFFANSVIDHTTFLPSFTIEAIYQFGNSISDTGNAMQENALHNCAHSPYGQTYFHKPTGRCSDGLLIIDYFTNYFNLPFLDPYLNKHGNFTHGVNFAVGGASALNISTLSMKGITSYATHSSLLVQIDWFKSYLSSICFSTSECKAKLAKALVIVGEIGGNDYFFAFLQRKTMKEVYEMVSEVVQTIKNAIEEVINLGAIRIVVPGNFPIGCYEMFISFFKTNDSRLYDDFDEHECHEGLNSFAKFHNDKLQEVIGELQKDHPDVTIMYADYFSSMIHILNNATFLGFDKDKMQKACCGIIDSDPHEMNANKHCGNEGVPVCEDPHKRWNWDGLHLTQHAYQLMAKWLIKHIFLDPPPQFHNSLFI